MSSGNGETPLPEQPESSRGAGGKARKPPNRKPRPTPYARPPPPNQSQTPLAVRGGDGAWFGKLLDPACRLIGAGVSRLLPGFLSRSLAIEPSVSSYADEDHDKLQAEAEHEDEEEINQGNSDLALTRSIQSANAENIQDNSKRSRPFDGNKEERSTNLPNADGLVDVEQLIKGKAFSRDEVDRLMEILRSKTVDLPRDDVRDKQPAADVKGVVQGPATTLELASKLKEDKREPFNKASTEVLTPLPKSNLRNEIGASPVDIARAYMGHQKADIGPSFVTTATGDDRPLVHLDGNSSSPLIKSPSHNSSVRWPGATVPDRYLTPQTQRSRYGLHDLRRTPYSRPTLSMSKSKLIQTGDDANKSSGTESPLLKQSWTAINPQTRSRSNMLGGGYGSVGPVRRARHTFGIGTPRKFDNFPSLASPSQRDKFSLPSASVPAYRKNMDAGGMGSTSKPHWAEDRPQNLDIGVPTVPRHSSQMARKILEQLDRTFPTPKEKSAELKLATSWKKPTSSSEAVLLGDAALSLVNMGKRWNDNAAPLHESRGTSSFKLLPERSSIRIADPVERKTSDFDADLRSSDPATGTIAESAYKVSKLAPAATESQPRDDAAKKPPASAARAALPSISIEKPELRPALFSGTSSGFTFPVSAPPASFPEPPTPSITPPPSLANSHHVPEEEASVPSFTFGSNRSSPALVFSFPSSSSSSSAAADAAEPEFTFGSGEKRLSFAAITRDGVCC